MAVPEYEGLWLRAGKPKADQVRDTGAWVVVAACRNCRLQRGDLNRHYALEVEISALADLVVRAMRPPQDDKLPAPVREEALAA
jgi:Fe-S oxidoreductase